MVPFAAILFLLGVELALGALYYVGGAFVVPRLLPGGTRASRRIGAAWAAAGSSALRLLPFALALSLGGASLVHGIPRGRAQWPSAVAFLGLGAWAAASGWMLLRAGWLERRGRVGRARRVGRLAGELMFVACLAQIVVMWVDLLFRPGFRVAIVRDDHEAALLLASSMLGLGIAAFVAILAGLAGKPRPAGLVAFALYAASFACAGLAADRVRHAVDPLSYGHEQELAARMSAPSNLLFTTHRDGSDR